MVENKECKIVQDLLPNYIENLTDEETNKYIEEHIRSCKECEITYENMKKELKIHTKKSDKKEIKEINGFKKYNNKLRFFKGILFLIILIGILIFTITTGRKMIIISKLYNKAKEYENSNNFHITQYYYEDGQFHKSETFVLEDKMKVQGISIDGEDVSKAIDIGNKIGNEYEFQYYEESNDKKITIINNSINDVARPTNLFYTENLWDLFKSAVTASIKEKDIKGKKYYYIEYLKTNNFNIPHREIYVNQETGLLSCVNEPKCNINEIIYEFNVVTEDDFIKPDTSDYTVYNNPQEYVKSFEEN